MRPIICKAINKWYDFKLSAGVKKIPNAGTMMEYTSNEQCWFMRKGDVRIVNVDIELKILDHVLKTNINFCKSLFFIFTVAVLDGK